MWWHFKHCLLAAKPNVSLWWISHLTHLEKPWSPVWLKIVFHHWNSMYVSGELVKRFAVWGIRKMWVNTIRTWHKMSQIGTRVSLVTVSCVLTWIHTQTIGLVCTESDSGGNSCNKIQLWLDMYNLVVQHGIPLYIVGTAQCYTKSNLPHRKHKSVYIYNKQKNYLNSPDNYLPKWVTNLMNGLQKN